VIDKNVSFGFLKVILGPFFSQQENHRIVPGTKVKRGSEEILDSAFFSRNQGDRMGRVFTHWVIVCSEQFFWEITKVPRNFGPILSTVKVQHSFWEKMIGLHFGRFFQKLIWSPWPRLPRVRSRFYVPRANGLTPAPVTPSRRSIVKSVFVKSRRRDWR
jgi:hypothetical protein